MDKLGDLWPLVTQGGISQAYWDTHSKHGTLSHLARTRIEVYFSASFGGRRPIGRSFLEDSPVHPLMLFVAFCHIFCFLLVNFALTARTSSSWWDCDGLQDINFIPRTRRTKQARLALNAPWLSRSAAVCSVWRAALRQQKIKKKKKLFKKSTRVHFYGYKFNNFLK